MSPRFSETGDSKRVRDMQAIKRAKDKDRERGAINTLHNAHFSLVLKQKGKEKRERGRERESADVSSNELLWM